MVHANQVWKGLRDLFADSSSLYLVNLRTDVLCFDMDTWTVSLNHRSSQCDLGVVVFTLKK